MRSKSEMFRVGFSKARKLMKQEGFTLGHIRFERAVTGASFADAVEALAKRKELGQEVFPEMPIWEE